MKKKLRAIGRIMSDLEPLLQEMSYDHEMQWYEILNLVRGYLEVHCPEGKEEYTDGSGSPEFYYGPKKEI